MQRNTGLPQLRPTKQNEATNGNQSSKLPATLQRP
jgi:hypothetical protein